MADERSFETIPDYASEEARRGILEMAEESEPQTCAVECCEHLIRHWCETVEDGNPLYLDEAYAKSLRGDFATGGDIAYFDEDGFYYICDRQKDMLISGGANIYPKEIENVLESHPDIFESAVIGLPNEEWGERPHALIVLNQGAQLTSDEILSFCRQHLASYKVPSSLAFVDELPHMVSGKLAKRELRDRLRG